MNMKKFADANKFFRSELNESKNTKVSVVLPLFYDKDEDETKEIKIKAS